MSVRKALLAPELAGNIAKATTPFGQGEYHSRLKRFHEGAGRTCDVSVIVDAANICYLSGYLGESGYVPQGLVIAEDPLLPRSFLRRQDAPAAMYWSFMPNDYIEGYSEDFIGHRERSGFDVIFDHVAELGARTVGVEMDSMAAADIARIKSRNPSLRLVDISGEVVNLRLLKSSLEIAVQREAAKITDHVMGQVPRYFEESEFEYQVAAKISAGLIEGVDGLAGHKTDPLVMPGCELSGTSHITWRDAPLKRGGHYNPEFGAARFGYCAGLMRTVVLGRPQDKLSQLYGAMVEGCDRALEAVRPGQTCGDVATAYLDVLEKRGYWKDTRCGYPIGINWLETSCSLRHDDPTILEPNMVFHLMLGTWLYEDFGAVISETFRVTDDGVEVLTQSPRELLIVD